MDEYSDTGSEAFTGLELLVCLTISIALTLIVYPLIVHEYVIEGEVIWVNDKYNYILVNLNGTVKKFYVLPCLPQLKVGDKILVRVEELKLLGIVIHREYQMISVKQN